MKKNNNQTKLSKQSRANLEKELKDLEENQLPVVVERIAKAREQGDLSENSEYKDAKDQQELLEVRIGEIQNILANSVVEECATGEAGAQVGCKVTLENDRGRQNTYTIVAEYDESAGGGDTLSSVSPMGKALLGKMENEEFDVQVPAGACHFRVVKIN